MNPIYYFKLFYFIQLILGMGAWELKIAPLKFYVYWHNKDGNNINVAKKRRNKGQTTYVLKFMRF